MRPSWITFALVALLPANHAQADWKDDVGYTRLNQTFATGVPTAVASGVTQAEASDSNGNSYQPDFSNPEFTGKTLTVKSSGTGLSGHATTVAAYFYGNYTSIIPSNLSVDSYNANSWLAADLLNYGTSSLPLTEARRVENHSWISVFDTSTGTPAQINSAVTNIDQRLDYAINRDGFVSVAGAKNGASTTLPDLMVQAYHGLSVGLVSGNHSAGLTTSDGIGRMKPDLVAFESLTSFATPQVSSAAALISEKLRNTAYTPALATADYPRLTKALLLAGAAKDPLASWSRADTTKPYDAVYGAGALNVFLAYRILAAGKQSASTTTAVAETGWDINTAASSSSRLYFFDIPVGTASTRFSAALTWHRAVSTNNILFGTAATLANLDLKLFAATGTTLGTQLDASISTVDNVEHIYQPVLAPGRYALQVTSASGTGTPYALAWRTSPTVTVAATTPTALEIDGTPGIFTLTRTGSTTSPLLVPLAWSGTAVAGTHYVAPPTTLLIPAGNASATVQITPISDDIAQGDRTVVLTVANDFSLSAGANTTATAILKDKPYDTWRFLHFTTAELAEPAISGPTADPDADVLPNLMEYALGADPKASDAPAHAPSVSVTADHLTLTYTRPTAITDISYTIEWTSDLQTWSTGDGVTETVGSTDNTDGTTTVVARSAAPLGTAPRQFLRLRVTRP